MTGGGTALLFRAEARKFLDDFCSDVVYLRLSGRVLVDRSLATFRKEELLEVESSL